jgi:hypothetical protein
MTIWAGCTANPLFYVMHQTANEYPGLESLESLDVSIAGRIYCFPVVIQEYKQNPFKISFNVTSRVKQYSQVHTCTLLRRHDRFTGSAFQQPRIRRFDGFPNRIIQAESHAYLSGRLPGTVERRVCRWYKGQVAKKAVNR